MWITSEVDLPEEVVEAHVKGDLVFFVGAGASVAKPSSLPLFEGLAKQLARRASHPFSKRGGLDFLIGCFFRVVTTNYDDHIASAASDARIPIADTWYGPALPIGRDFVGLVHLRGSMVRRYGSSGSASF